MKREGKTHEKDFVDVFEDDLHKVGKELDDIGNSVCGFLGSSPSRGFIDEAVGKIQEAIHMAYLMRVAAKTSSK